MEKTIKQEFDINAVRGIPQTNGVKIFSQDVNSAIFDFSFTDNGKELSLDDSYSADILFTFRESGRKILDHIIVTDDNMRYTFKSELIDSWDIVDAYLYLYKDDIKIDVAKFNFKVDRSEIDNTIKDLEMFYVNDVDSLRDEYRTLLDVLIAEFEDKKEIAIKDIDNSAEKYLQDVADIKAILSGSTDGMQEKIQDLIDDQDKKATEFRKNIDNKVGLLKWAYDEFFDNANQSMLEFDSEVASSKAIMVNILNELKDNGGQSIDDVIDSVKSKASSVTGNANTANSEINKSLDKLQDQVTKVMSDVANENRLATLSIQADKKYVSSLKDQAVTSITSLPNQVSSEATKAITNIKDINNKYLNNTDGLFKQIESRVKELENRLGALD